MHDEAEQTLWMPAACSVSTGNWIQFLNGIWFKYFTLNVKWLRKEWLVFLYTECKIISDNWF